MTRRLLVGTFFTLCVAVAASCSSEPEGSSDEGASGGSHTAGAAGAPSGGNASSSGGTADSGGTASSGGTATTGGNASTGGALGGNGGAQGGAGGVGVTPAAEGEPCPNGDECGESLVCVGYGNPLPNGESSACRLICDSQSAPAGCNCASGYCEPIPDPYVNGCADMIENAGCADAKQTTLDFQSARFQGCGHWTDLGNGEGWIEYGESYSQGFAVDTKSGLGWLTRPSAGTKTLAEVEAFCADLEVRGLTEWRVPTIDEARALAGGCANTAPGGSCPLSDSTPCLDQSCGQSSECTSCVASGGPHNGSYCRAEVTICSGFHTTSECTDCASPGNWRYAPGNGNFHASSTTSLTHAVCVMDDVPHGVPCSD